MSGLERWFREESHNYILIAIAALLFFGIKAIIGYLTYRHYNRKLDELESKLDTLLLRQKE